MVIKSFSSRCHLVQPAELNWFLVLALLNATATASHIEEVIIMMISE